MPHRLLPLFLALGALAWPAWTSAAPPWRAGAGTEIAASNGISLEQAVSMVRQRTGGKVLRADARERGGRDVYRIRVLLPDGRVRTFHVDARTGRID